MSSLQKMCRKCASTVCREMISRSATCRFVIPCATSEAKARSASVSVAHAVMSGLLEPTYAMPSTMHLSAAAPPRRHPGDRLGYTGSISPTERESQMPKLDAHVLHHPAVIEEFNKRASDAQLRVADQITAFAGSMNFV